MQRIFSLLALAVLLAPNAASRAANPPPTGGSAAAETPLAGLEWRNLGPVNMSGRVSDVEGVPGDPKVVYVGAASGGVWKTTDGGLTFAPIFDDQPIASIGDMAIAPGHPEILYVGSGESNVRNSVSFGNGVYKTTDGGASWTHLGLEKTRHISRLAVHPDDPDTVWVGALGSIYGPSEERGVFKTTDGGKTWRRTLFLDPRHGVADLDLDPTNPKILFAALWHFERKPWTFTSGGEEGGVWRSVDGGETWKKIGEGLPKMLGRVAVKVAPSRPETVYVMAESNDGVLFRSDDRGTTFRQVSDQVDLVSRGFYYTDLRVDPTDENRLYAVASRLFRSIDGGKTFERIAPKVHIDFHSLWIDPEDPSRLWVGEDGGVAVSYDRAQSWEPLRNLPIGQLYQIFHDHREPFYQVGGGLQDNGTWYGPHRTREPAGILPDDWRMMSFGDAYWVVPHPEREDVFLSEYQAGGILRTDMRTRRQVDVSPQPRRNDGGPAGELEVRFNWNAPIVASPHDPGVVYFAGSKIFKTTDFGDTWTAISPDLTTNDPEKLVTAGGPVWPENTTAEYHCTVISFAESPVEPGVLWAGTDDGNLQLSRDGGASWENLASRLPGVPAFSPVSHIEPSRVDGDVVYAAFDRHMFDDPRPHIYKSTNGGGSWTRIVDGLPEEGWVWVVREDPRNPSLIYAGTELGLWASRDAGGSWEKLHLANLPTVAVHDILVHPRDNDLLLGTHGRAIWILDDAAPIQQWSTKIADRAAHLFPPRPALRFPTRFTRYGLGDKKYVAPNPPDGAILTYYLKESLDAESGPDEKKEKRFAIEILNAEGEIVRTLDADKLEHGAGMHRATWDLRQAPPRPRNELDPGGGDFGGPPAGAYVLPGVYTARLTVDRGNDSKLVVEQSVEVRIDPLVEASPAELAAQYAAAARLTEMRGAVNDALRALDIVGAQIEERRATWKNVGRELDAELQEHLKTFEKARAERLRLFVREEGKTYWSQGPRLSDHLDTLFGNIDSAFAAPTAAQLAHLEELEGEWTTAMASVRDWLEADAAELNAALVKVGIPPLLVPRLEAP